METNVINNGCKDRFTKKYYMFFGIPFYSLFYILYRFVFQSHQHVFIQIIHVWYHQLQLRFKQHANSITKEQKKYSATEDSSPV